MTETIFTRIFQDAAAERPALSGAGQSWTYGQLKDDAEQLADGLQQRGLRPGDRVAVVADNHPVTLVVWLAGARAGYVTCVVNSLLKPQELARLLARVQPRVVFVDEAHRSFTTEAIDAAGLRTELVGLEAGSAPGWHDLLGEPATLPHPAPEDPVEITFTSGTTGVPKGALFCHAAHLYSVGAWSAHVGFNADDVTYTFLPLFHAGGMRNATLATLFGGGHVVVGRGFSASQFWPTIESIGATFIIIVETVVAILLRRGGLPAGHRLRLIGGPGQPDLLEPFEAALGVRSIQNYGLTETGSITAIPTDIPPGELKRRRRHSVDSQYVGKPLGDSTAVRVVTEDRRVADPWERGEIQVRTPGRFNGYFDAPEETGAVFVDGWFRTGDLGYLSPDGDVYFVERIKELIRRGGENLSPREVEDVLCAHPAVAEAAVYAVPDPIRMEEIKALVVVDRGTKPDELWTWCSERLAEFKVPRYIEFREQLPRNRTGRVLKRDLRREPLTGLGSTYDRTTGPVVPADDQGSPPQPR